ncbi:ATM1-like ABC transporter [Cryptosporidium canis]|nr:ATM1-like ABC transporter [Cryptosporidium canis]
MWAILHESTSYRLPKLLPVALCGVSAYRSGQKRLFAYYHGRKKDFYNHRPGSLLDYNIGSKFISNYRERRNSNNLLMIILKKSGIIQGKDSKTIEILTKYLWPDNKKFRRRIICSLLSLGVAKLATIQAPLLLSRLIDTLGTTSTPGMYMPSMNKLNVILLICSYGIARISSSGFNELRNSLFSEVSQSACKDLSLKAFHHFHNVSNLNFIQSHRSGELLTIITRGFKSVSQLLNIMIFQIIPTTAEFLMVLGILLHKVGSEVAFITMATMIAYMDFTRRVTNKRTIYRKNMNKSEQKSNGLLSDSLINAETIKYLNGETYMYDLYSRYQERYKNSNVKVQTSLAFLNFGQNCIFTGGLLSAMLVTTDKVLKGMLPMGSIVLVTSLLFQLAIPLNFIGMIYRETKLTMIDLSKLNEYLTTQSKINEDSQQKYTKKLDSSLKALDLYREINQDKSELISEKKSIKLDNVSFSFPTIEKDQRYYEIPSQHNSLVIENLTLNIPFGKKIGFVGPSGSGKTTLSKLIYRIFEPNTGKIRIYDREIGDFEINEYRRCFSVLPQDVLLFNMTIFENLKIANSKATIDEIVSACKLAGIHENIIRMKRGYDTVVGERGCTLSGGEKQRLGFARMLLKKSHIWILDEPTSALDLLNHNYIIRMLSLLHSHSVSNTKALNVCNSEEPNYSDVLSSIPYANDKDEIIKISKLIGEIVKFPITIIVIAHRLSSVRNFDLIAYFEDGSVKEIGNHEQLIENGMHYYQLWNKQHLDSILK